MEIIYIENILNIKFCILNKNIENNGREKYEVIQQRFSINSQCTISFSSIFFHQKIKFSSTIIQYWQINFYNFPKSHSNIIYFIIKLIIH